MPAYIHTTITEVAQILRTIFRFLGKGVSKIPVAHWVKLSIDRLLERHFEFWF